jgi:hypothetical protein
MTTKDLDEAEALAHLRGILANYLSSSACSLIPLAIEKLIDAKLRSATPSEGEKERKATAPVVEAGELPEVLPAGTRAGDGVDVSGAVRKGSSYELPNGQWYGVEEIDRSTLPDARGGERAEEMPAFERAMLWGVVKDAWKNAIGRIVAHGGTLEKWNAASPDYRLEAACGELEEAAEDEIARIRRRRISNPEPPKAAEERPDAAGMASIVVKQCPECGRVASRQSERIDCQTCNGGISPKPPESPPVPDAGGKSDEELQAIAHGVFPPVTTSSVLETMQHPERLLELQAAANRALYNAGRADERKERK